MTLFDRDIILILLTPVLLLSACATVSEKQKNVQSPVIQKENNIAPPALSKTGKHYKRKIAILRFSNETNYGRALLSSEDYERVGKQTSDMLASRLVESGEFLVFERPDLSKLKDERKGTAKSELVGVDTVISGSLTEFGRSTDGKSGFLSSTKMQSAHAKVDVRLIDLETGHAFFSGKGAGKATTESGEVAGFGSRAEYDSTLNDKAIGAAVSDLIDNIVSKIKEKPWKTDVLDVQGSNIFISGGKTQGIAVGDSLAIMQAGKRVKSGQSGFSVDLPATKVAVMKVVTQFGDNETNEGSICELISKSPIKINKETMFVAEDSK